MKSHDSKNLALAFLTHHVIGKSVIAAPVVTKVENGEFTTAYEEDAVFSNLQVNDHGFSFDMTTLSRGTRYTGSDKLKAEGLMNWVRVVRYEFVERKSSGELTGTSRFISSTNTPDLFAGSTFFVRLKADEKSLTIEENQVGYADLPTHSGKFESIAIHGKYVYTVSNGHLQIKYDQQTFHVDPKTLGLTLVDKYPTQISKETPVPYEIAEVV